MALAYRLDAISQGPKKSRFPGPNPLPLSLVMNAARIRALRTGRMNHRCVVVLCTRAHGWFQGPYHPSSPVRLSNIAAQVRLSNNRTSAVKYLT